jgi:hypothetical protein
MPTENLPFRGRRTCICVVRIVPLVEAEMKRRGLIERSIDFFQMGYNRGGVSASAGTHDRGGAIDVAQHSPAQLAVWRMFGVRMQERTRTQGFDPHGHGWPGGCTHMSSGLRYQESEWRGKRNGLRGRGPVTGPGYTTITWQQAVQKYKPSPTAAKDLDVAKWIRFKTGKDQALPAKKWAYLKINDKGDVSLGTGPGKLLGTISLRIAGLPKGEALQLRVGKVTKRVHSWPITEVVGTSGDAFRVVPFTLSPGKAARGQRRIRAVVLADRPGVKITDAEIAYWKA